MGVDLFFNLPKRRQLPHYRYHTIKVPVRFVVVPDSTQTVQQIECDADWMGQLKIFLDKGWKLVDICIDTTALAEGYLRFQVLTPFLFGFWFKLIWSYIEI